MAVHRKPCIYALVKSVYDSHFDSTEVRGVAMFKSWKSARKGLKADYDKHVTEWADNFVAGTGTDVPADYATAEFSFDNPPLEGLELRWDIVKAETEGLK